MADDSKNIEIIYNEVLQKEFEEEKKAYLDKVCGNDHALRARVEELLKANSQAGSFLENPPIDTEVTLDESPLTEAPGTIIGRYKLLENIGEGGMATVYMAEQKHPIRRRVALKIIKLGLETRQVIGRFEAERQALAMMDHPNIARVFDAGTTETGRPYFVMELVKGVPITEFCDKNHLSPQERLELFISVCNAVQHAHQKGIIHRDIKPTNIMVTLHDGKPIVKVIDFGIAKALNQQLTEKTVFTRYSQMIGTPEYMSPEQAEMSGLDVDTRTDIYSLGVLLYELLTGSTPFDSEYLLKKGYGEMQRIIREEEPIRPSTKVSTLGDTLTVVAKHRHTSPENLRNMMRSDLDWIVMKTLEKDRQRRYENVSELSADIRRHLNNEPVIASPPSTVYRLKKFIRRNRAMVTGIAAVLVVLLAGIFVSTIFGMKANRQKQIAEAALENETIALNQTEQARKAEQQQREIAEQQNEEYRRSLYVRNVNLADKYYLENNASAMYMYLADCPNYLRRWEWDYLWRISDQSIMTLLGHEGPVNSVALSPDGSRIVSGSGDNTIKLWDAESGEVLRTLEGHMGGVTSVAFSPDGRRIASAGGFIDKTIKVWDAINGGEPIITLEGNMGRFASIVFSPDGRRIASAGGFGDRTIKVWDAINGGEPIITLEGHGAAVMSVMFSPDGSRIVSGSLDSTVRIWDAVTGEPIMTFKTLHAPILSVAFSPDGRRIASGSVGGDTTVKVWDAVNGGEPIMTLEHEASVMSVMFSPDGQKIVSCGFDRKIKIWYADSGDELFTLMGHAGPVFSAVFSPDGEQIVSGGWDGIKVWNNDFISEAVILRGHKDWVDWVTFSPDGKRILSGSYDGTLKSWDIESASEVMTLWGHQGFVHSVAFSPDGKMIVSGSFDKTLKLWDAENGKELKTLTGHNGIIYSVAFSPDSKRIVSASGDMTLRVWDANSGDEIMTLEATHQLSYVAFSPDGKRIVSGGGSNTLDVWDAVNGGEPIMTIQGHMGPIEPVVFSPDGSRIVSGGYWDNMIKVWDADSGDELLTLQGHNGSVISIVFSPDGSRIVSGSVDGTVRVWDAATGAELVTLRAGSGVLGVAFSPDGKTIAASRQEDNAVILWDSVLTDDEYEARKIGIAATTLVDELYEEHQYYTDVITQLNTDSMLDEQTRKIALQVANSRFYEDEVKDTE